MARTQVRILETFEVLSQLGELVVKEPRTGREDVIDGARTHKHVYTKGEHTHFSNKKAALAFIQNHPGKAELV